MARIPSEEIKAIKEKADIVDVIGHYIPVVKQGNTYKCICPFHDDHDPSMTINQKDKFYYCFVCDKGGDVFHFVQNYEKLDNFAEVVEKVADIIGYSLSVPVSVQDDIPQDPRLKRYQEILSKAIDFTVYQLQNQSSLPFIQYLEQRGIHEEVRKHFQIGVNPQGNTLYQFLKGNGYSDEELIACNVVNEGEYGYYDTFGGRITFPIYDYYGRPIGFSARSIQKNDNRKYINSNNNDLFQKSKVIYHYHQAKQAAKKEGQIFICEGVTDVIAFHQAGIDHAICTLGKACTEEHIRELKKLRVKLVFCYDGDRAGQEGIYKGAKLANAMKCDIAIVDNQSSKDPDEILRQDGAEELRKLANTQITWMEFLLKYYVAKTNMANYSDKKNMAQKAMEECKEFHDEIDKKVFVEQLSKITELPLTYKEEAKDVIQPKPKERIMRLPNGIVNAEEKILQMMLSSNEAIKDYETHLGFMIRPIAKDLALEILDMYRRYGEISIEKLLESIEDENMSSMLMKVSAGINDDIEYEEEKFLGYARTIQKAKYDETIRYLSNQLLTEADILKQGQLMDEIMKYEKAKKEI